MSNDRGLMFYIWVTLGILGTLQLIQIIRWLFYQPAIDYKRIHFYNVHIIPKSYRLSDPIDITYQIESNNQDIRRVSKDCSLSLGDGFTQTQSYVYWKGSMKTLPISGQLENAEAVRRLPPSLMLSILCGESRMLSHNITLFPYLFNQELVVETKQAYPTSPINILLAGQVGSGKSTLINSMFTCVNKDMVYVAGVMRKTTHATVTTSRFHLYGYNSYRQDIEPLNIAFTDTVGVSSINYNEDESIEFLLKGGIPDIMKEQEKAELEREIMLADQNITFWQQVFEKMSEEALKPNNNRGDFKESNKLEVLNFNIAAEMKRIEGLKKQLEQIELYLKKEREKQLPTLNTLQKRVHAIIFLVTHSPMQPDSDTPLRKNLVRFIERAVSLGYVPVVGVTNLLYSDVNKVRNEVANGLGVSSNNVFEVKANLEEKEKQFEVDKRIFEILLTAVQRGKQYIQKERIRLAKDEL